MNANGIRYRAPGPVAAAFFVDRSKVAAINGPIGSGKTTCNLMRHLFTGCQQMPSWKDGVRKYKLCVVRDTYRNLWKTTIPSWHKRFSDSMGRWVGSKDGPALHELSFTLPDSTRLLYQVDFVGIGENAAEDVLKGYEPTAFMLEEADGLADEVLQFARGRTGRYPEMDEGGPTWHGVTLGFNAPPLGSYCYTQFFKELPEGWKLFRQPSGLAPDAENIPNLPPGYYDGQIAGQPEWYVEKMIRNKPGVSRAGKPVYPEFSDTQHVADHRLEPLDGIQLQIGMDAGGTPAAAIGQHLPNGQWRIYAELTSQQGTGARRFGANLAQLIKERFLRFDIGLHPVPSWRTNVPRRINRMVRAWGDPSAAYGADRVNDEQDWLEIVGDVLGIRVDPAPTNNPTPRQDAVRLPLSRLIDGKPGLLLCPSCQTLRDGFNAGYHYKKIRSGGVDLFSSDVEKNEYSHVHDALQYLLSGGGEDLAIRGRKAASASAMQGQQQGGNDWDPFHVA